MKKEALQSTDYLPYYETYVSLVDNIPLIEALTKGVDRVTRLFEGLPESLHEYSYEEGKWTPKEILLHIIDTERVFAYRALTFARSQNAVLPGFDQDVFASNATTTNRTMDSLIEEYKATRVATLCFYESLDNTFLKQKGIASGGPLSVAAAGFIISGHEIHHCRILKERYIIPN